MQWQMEGIEIAFVEVHSLSGSWMEFAAQNFEILRQTVRGRRRIRREGIHFEIVTQG